MQFNSSLFIVSFSIFYIFYYFFSSNLSARKWLLLAASLGFYYFLSGTGIFILILVAFSDFIIAKSIYKSKSEVNKRVFLILSLVIDLGILLTWNHFSDWFSFSDLKGWPRVVGVSFFIFRSIGYVLDVQREMIDEPEHDFSEYLLFLSYFPLILVGPIQPARDFLPQIKKPFNASNVKTGAAIFFLISGIVKKYILANYLAINFVNRVFDNSHLFTGIENLMATFGQALVVYFDFSGYTDFIIGISLLLGIDIVANFNFPYVAQNISEYWRRWHISLSKWLNEYLYFPLAFSFRRLKQYGTVLAVMITFIVSGFWHGTKLHYTFWGMLHGIALSWDILTVRLRDGLKKRIPNYPYHIMSFVLTFLFLALSGIFFKADSIQSGVAMLTHIFNKPELHFFGKWMQNYPWVFAIILGSFLLQFVLQIIYDDLITWFEKLPAPLLSILLVATIFMAYQITGMDSLPFIYLDF